MDEAFFDAMVGVILKGVYFTISKALPYVNDGGAIVCLGASSTYLGGMHGDWGIYTALKKAAVSLVKSFAIDPAPGKIRVNSVSPGFTDTPTVAELCTELNLKKEALARMIPLGSVVTPEEIAQSVLFYCSEQARTITGPDLCVDGGFTQKPPSGLE